MITALRLGWQIAAVRLVMLWAGFWLWNNSDWRQVLGYFVLLVNSLFEMMLVRAWRANEAVWPILLSVVVAGTSMVLAFVWTGFVNYFRLRVHHRR